MASRRDGEAFKGDGSDEKGLKGDGEEGRQKSVKVSQKGI